MNTYAKDRQEFNSGSHESRKHILRDERKSEELKLDRLKKILQTGVNAKTLSPTRAA
jgi:hypothetical protein